MSILVSLSTETEICLVSLILSAIIKAAAVRIKKRQPGRGYQGRTSIYIINYRTLRLNRSQNGNRLMKGNLEQVPVLSEE